MESAVNLISSQAIAKKLSLVYEIDRKCPVEIMGDVTRIRQILLNLMSNAVKFTKEGSIHVTVTVENLPEVRFEDEQDPVKLLFSVKDTGVGIPSDRFDKLFTSFSQVDESTTREYGGTGLGLAISKRLSEMMGGSMWVDSVPNVGSTFYFNIILDSPPANENAFVSGLVPTPATVDMVQVPPEEKLVKSMMGTEKSMISIMPPKEQSVPNFREVRPRAGSGMGSDMKLPYQQPRPEPQSRLGEGIEVPMAKRLSLQKARAASKRNAGGRSSIDTPSSTGYASPSLAAAAAALSSTARKMAKVRVLVVDDNPVNLKVVSKMLARLGVKPDEANNGQEAVELIEKNNDGQKHFVPYDLIFMDIWMPKMNGLDASVYIRKHLSGGTSDRPYIIAMTACVMPGDREKCIAAGMNDYISKPLRKEELEQCLRIFTTHHLRQ
ncbi:histidine kinase-like ATPase [Lobosporangium transversale]|uniref:Histidine kinase-like ATPase n=1 Tax=Lobosporangium transversale TaxID=64571 RepID=A0A1Y2GYZ3_9FUNG|nr:histidine kinase-like ATPase [Lobosporangium transversale]ORZ27507.1 histidine kinase-like ATPase [Lobosporangium transversale]|eukprot:XP_021885234.1 histidine kinase-like ATPase [Lobosporangium transversale]